LKLNKSNPIGIFDSGLGGLTVLKELQKALPNESYLYFGDLAHVPYGNKSQSLITNYSDKIAKYLISQKVKLIVIACNSASSIALGSLQKKYDIPFVGVIDPSVDSGIKNTATKHVAVIGTEATIKSKAYSKNIKKYDPSIEIYEYSCPLLVPLIEEGWTTNKITDTIVKEYLQPIKENSNIDTLILGCTHYPILEKNIKSYLGNEINVVSCGPAISKKIKKYLESKSIIADKTARSKTVFIVSDISDKFYKTASIFLDKTILDVKEINPFDG